MTVEQLWHFHRSPKDPCPFLGDNTELEGRGGFVVDDHRRPVAFLLRRIPRSILSWCYTELGLESHGPFFLGVTPTSRGLGRRDATTEWLSESTDHCIVPLL